MKFLLSIWWHKIFVAIILTLYSQGYTHASVTGPVVGSIIKVKISKNPSIVKWRYMIGFTLQNKINLAMHLSNMQAKIKALRKLKVEEP